MPLPILAGVAMWKIVAGAVAVGVALWAVVQIAKIVIGVVESVAGAVASNLPLFLGVGLLIWFLVGAPASKG